MSDAATEILGNQDLRARLASLATQDRLHPCLIFEGPVGLGKHMSARWLASICNCGAAEALRPCGACWSCKQIARGTHPDILEIGLDPERTAPIISVEQARNLVSKLVLHPYQARRRFVILDPADALSPEAGNALLKTLEEPPAATTFVLISAAASRLLATVRSRSQRVRWSPVPDATLTAWLAARGIEEAAWVAKQAGGCPGAALALAEGEAAAGRAARDDLIGALAGTMEGLFAFAESLVKGERGDWLPRVERGLDALSRLARDAMLLAAGGSADRLYNPDRHELLLVWSTVLGAGGARRIGDAVDAARRDIEAYVNARLLMEVLLTTVAAELGVARLEGASR